MSASLRKVRRKFTAATPLGVFLVATLALSGWLGFQALDAARSHRLTAEAVLRDYALISATALARFTGDDIDDLLDDVFTPVFRRRRGAALPSPAVLQREVAVAAREQRCACPAFGTPLALLRFDPLTREAEVIPDTLPPATQARVAERVLSQRPSRGRVQHGLLTVAGASDDDRLVVAYVVTEDGDGALDAAYAVLLSPAALSELFTTWYGRRRLLPQPIAGDLPNDSLLFASIQDVDGTRLFTSSVGYPSTLSASAALAPEFAGLLATVAIRPDAAAQLVIGGLPNSRLPLLAALVLLTLGVGAATFLQLRREQAFQRLREDFVSGVSHELRTPLAQIRIFAELQEAGKLRSDADRQRATLVINREARRLSHLVENILQFSQSRRAPGQGAPPEALDLADALAEGIDAVTPLLVERNMTLEVAASPAVVVVANRDALTRIVVNLLDNAVKYGPRGQTVKVGVERVNGSARLAVSDEGPGVPIADRTRVWKPYRRLDRDIKANIPGTGIGLSVVADLASLYGGKVWVEGSPEQGAIFVVELPVADAARGIDARGGAE